MLQTTTFLGEIQGGRILTDQPLADFEGQQVLITLKTPGPSARVAAPPTASDIPVAAPYAPEEAEILEDTGRIRLPPREVSTFHLKVVDVGRQPMPVYPSDLED